MPKNYFLRLITFSAIFIVAAISIFSLVQLRIESRANDFCNSVKIGANTGGLLESAADNGARVPKQRWSNGPGSSKTLYAKFTGIDPMYGYFCVVSASGNIVTSKQLNLLDP